MNKSSAAKKVKPKLKDTNVNLSALCDIIKKVNEEHKSVDKKLRELRTMCAPKEKN